MSKIEIIQNAIDEILRSNYGNNNLDVSCILFNGEYKLMSTLPIKETLSSTGKMTIEEINQSIQTVECYGSTDFNKIMEALSTLSEAKNDKDEIRIIASDGFYTGYNTTLNSFLESYFNLSIGVGNSNFDFDKAFLEKIAIFFVHGNSSDIITQSINNCLNIKENFFLYLPENINYICSNGVVEDHNEYIPLIESTMDSLDTFNTELIQGELQITCKINFKKRSDNVHLILVIDISGSMQDILLETSNSSIENKFKICKTKRLTKINIISDKTELILFDNCLPIKLFIEKNDLISEIAIINTPISPEGLFYDTLLSICQEIEQINLLENNDIKVKWIADLYNTSTMINNDFENYLKDIYNTALNSKEKNYFKLLHDTKFEINNKSRNTEMKEKDASICLICCVNKRNVVLSCFHIVMCDSCTKKLPYNEIKCPICREKSQWIKQCRYLFNNLKCINCDNKISIMFYNCNHIYYCNDCYTTEIKECLCGLPIDSYSYIIFN